MISFPKTNTNETKISKNSMDTVQNNYKEATQTKDLKMKTFIKDGFKTMISDKIITDNNNMKIREETFTKTPSLRNSLVMDR